MPLSKLQITIACENCSFQGTSSNDPHAFFVRVGIKDEKNSRGSTAMIECRVDEHSHDVRLVDLDEDTGIDRERLEEALKIVSEKRLCGNNRICPAEIVRIVEQIQNEGDSD